MNYLVNSTGQATIKKLSYAPIPTTLKSKDQSVIDGMQCNGAAIKG